MINLSTTYLGLHLNNPLVVSASPLSGDLDKLRQMEQAGAAAIVLPSLFAEQIQIANMRLSAYVPNIHNWLPEDLKHIPDMAGYNQGVNQYIAHLYEAKKAVNIPIIASLNAYNGGGWAQYARIIEAAGADALELNLYYLAGKPLISGSEIEQMYLNLLYDIKSHVKQIPIAVKISPFFSSIAHMAANLHRAGANGLVLFNRFYQPDFDIETQTIKPELDFSTSAELRLRLRWVAMLYGRVRADFAITGGVHTAEDVIKSIMAGAKVTMMASALYQHGIAYLETVLGDLVHWLEMHEYDSIQELQGCLSQEAVANPTVFERANYMNVLKTKEVA